MSSRQVAIIGIDAISSSMAFALKEHEGSVTVVGYDADPAVADLARVRGAFDKVRRKPGVACQGADLVIVAEPVNEIESAFAAISPHLEDEAIITDTARLKRPVLRWAQDLLPEDVSFVGGHLIPNPAIIGLRSLKGLDDASSDLLRDALYCFTPSPTASSAAVDTCLWLAAVVGASPFFIDVKEHDGLLAGVEGLPDLLTVALLHATVDTPGWEEMRKFAGHRFASATEAVDDVYRRHPALFLNRENVLRRLDALIEELAHLRRVLARGDEEALAEALAEAAEGRSRWMAQRGKGMWTEEASFDVQGVPSAGEQLRRMFLGGLGSSRRRADRRPPGESDET